MLYNTGMIDPDHFLQKLRTNNLKVTPSRLAVLEVMSAVPKPLDVQGLIEKLKELNIETDQATVYRILTLFVQKGLVEQIDFRDGKYRYELQSEHHHHLVCENCGKIEEVEGELITIDEKKIGDSKKFLITSHALEFFGLCKNCH